MADTPAPSGSLADRITQPLNAASSTFSPSSAATEKSSTSWADDVASPTTAKEEKGDLAAAQVDGSYDDEVGPDPLHEPQYEIEVKLSDIQGDKDSPLYSVSSFEQLGMQVPKFEVINLANICDSSEQVLKGIYTMNFKKPSKIQERALPLLLRNPPSNMIAQSQSGTGKTAAFVLTILSRIDYSKPTSPQALILAPSRELARQIEGVVRSIGQFVDGLTIQAAVPGAVQRNAKLAAMVIVGTPGTVMDLIKRRQFDPSEMKILCLDEADNMLDQQGLGEQCIRVKMFVPTSILQLEH